MWAVSATTSESHSLNSDRWYCRSFPKLVSDKGLLLRVGDEVLSFPHLTCCCVQTQHTAGRARLPWRTEDLPHLKTLPGSHWPEEVRLSTWLPKLTWRCLSPTSCWNDHARTPISASHLCFKVLVGIPQPVGLTLCPLAWLSGLATICSSCLKLCVSEEQNSLSVRPVDAVRPHCHVAAFTFLCLSSFKPPDLDNS